MPSSSKKQHNFMEAVAHNPAFAKKAGVPQSVGKEFLTADKGKTFKRGGEMATKKMDPKMMAMMAAKKRAGMGAGKGAMGAAPAPTGMMGMRKGGSVGTTKMGAVKTAAPSRDGVAAKGKTKGKMVKMNKGGKAC
jgi:hypothetical protein